MLTLCVTDMDRWISEFDGIQNSLRAHTSQGCMVTIEDIVDLIKAETGNEIPASCDWLLVQLAIAMLRLVMVSPG